MKANLLPVFFPEANEQEHLDFKKQVDNLICIFGEVANFLPEVSIDDKLPQADAIVFPKLMSGVYRYDEILKRIILPIIILTSRFGTVEMWDWEISTYLRELGLKVFSPYQVSIAKVILRSLAIKRQTEQGAKFLIFQDNPSEGIRPDIFKRFYWWERNCTERIQEKLGCQLIYQSWKDVCDTARRINDETARITSKDWDIRYEGVSEQQFLKAVKLFIVLNNAINEIGDIAGVSSNCMNEANFCDSTPCLAWNMLFEQRGIIWACESDTVSLLSIYLIYKSTQRPLMMTNLYPFLSGMSALAHEKIDKFPEVSDPDNCALGIHCGYLGFAPRQFCTEWTFRPKVLTVANENAMALDCRLPIGKVTLAKIFPSFEKMNVIEAEIIRYVQYPGSHCLNGALLHYKDGHKVMETLSSHHSLIISGDAKHELIQLANVFGFEVNLI